MANFNVEHIQKMYSQNPFHFTYFNETKYTRRLFQVVL